MERHDLEFHNLENMQFRFTFCRGWRERKTAILLLPGNDDAFYIFYEKKCYAKWN